MTNVRPATGDALHEAAQLLRRGGLVAFPTETVYGLGADARNPRAVRRVFEAKGRPADNPLIVHVPDEAAAWALAASVPDAAHRLAHAHWPGPLTLVLDRAPDAGIAPEATGGLPTLALRVPGHPVAHALLLEAGVPVAAPSANRSGNPSPVRAEHVARDLGDRVDLILDGGPSDVGLESTVVDARGPRPVLLRPGAITLEDLEQVAGPVDVHPAVHETLTMHDHAPSPGMKYRHYAPHTPLTLFEGPPGKRVHALAAERDRLQARGKRVLLLVTEESGFTGPGVRLLGRRNDPHGIARHLYDALRDLDRDHPDHALVEGIEPRGIGLALMNRLRKAAGGDVVRV